MHYAVWEVVTVNYWDVKKVFGKNEGIFYAFIWLVDYWSYFLLSINLET